MMLFRAFQVCFCTLVFSHNATANGEMGLEFVNYEDYDFSQEHGDDYPDYTVEYDDYELSDDYIDEDTEFHGEDHGSTEETFGNLPPPMSDEPVLVGTHEILVNDNTKCEANVLAESECIDGHKLVTHEYPQLDSQGNWFCAQKNATVSCNLETCDCQAVGDPHYRTYDGQLIHYYGVCRYILSRSLDRTDPCYFNVEVQNEQRVPNMDVSYTAYIDIEIGNAVFRLDQKRCVTMNDQLIIVPYHDDHGVNIFYSGRLVQFVHEKCGIKVSFDGTSDAFVSVPYKHFAGRMEGLCGDCNSKKDDYRTRDGEDVSQEQYRFNLIGDSYRVNVPGEEQCSAAAPPPEDFCDEEWQSRVTEYEYCGVLAAPSGPFGDCLASGKVNATQMFEICRVDICSVSSDEKRIVENRCEILNALQEECSEAGFSGIVWRQRENCNVECGRNQVFDPAMNPCQDTCSSHFYGTKLDCYGLPAREGCRCEEGYLLDGELCVKPDDCQCLGECVDTETPENCAQWVKEGQCKDYPAIMDKFCKRSCAFCVPEDKPCQDKISSERCLSFRKQGLCNQDFHKVVCGLTCNYEKCPCPTSQQTEDDCAGNTLVKHIYTTVFVRNEETGMCEKEEITTVEPCGDCPTVQDEQRSPCNYCTGEVTVSVYTQGRNEDDECVSQTEERVEACGTCPRNEVSQTSCENPDIITTVTFQEVENCTSCEQKFVTSTVPVLCNGPETEVTECDPNSCLQNIISYSYNVENCLCQVSAIPYERTCCCPEPTTARACRDGVDMELTTTYELIDNECESFVEERIIEKNPPCNVADSFSVGECDPVTCFANDISRNFTVDVTCNCIEIVDNFARVCCCPETETSTHCNLDTGVVTFVTETYNLNGDTNSCDKTRQVINSETVCAEPATSATDDCDYSTCLQRTTFAHQVRVGCDCEWTSYTVDSTCCCLEQPFQEEICQQDKRLVLSAYSYLLENNCTKQVVDESYTDVICPADDLQYGSCEDPSNQFNTLTTFAPVDCKCQASVERLPLNCACDKPAGDRVFDECDAISCFRTWRQVYYTVSPSGGCQENTLQSTEPCCCLAEDTSNTYCDISSGHEVTETTTTEFDDVLLTCQTTTSKLKIPYECAGETVETTDCGSYNTYFYEEITRWEERNNQDCTCESREKRRAIRCSCPDGDTFDPVCVDSGDQYEHKSVEYVLTQDSATGDFSCVPQYTLTYEPVLCNANSVEETTCNNDTCIYTEVKTFYSVENCQCKVRTESYEHFCCCSPPLEETGCRSPVIYTTYYTETLNGDKTECIPNQETNTTTITCDQPEKVYESQCDDNCQITRTIEKYAVEDCKCQVVDTVSEIRLCCCPEPISAVVCEGNFNVLKLRQYTLNEQGVCDPTDLEEKSPILCDDSESYWEECDEESGTRNYVTLFYVVVDCQCEQRKTVLKEVPCVCPPDIDIITTDCIDFVRRQQLFQYQLVDDECKRLLVEEFEEACEIDRWEETKECVNSSVFVQTRTHQYLSPTKSVNGILLNELVTELIVKTDSVVCKEPVTEFTECIDFKRCQKTLSEVPVNCECKSQEEVHDCEACNCDKKNNEVKVCAGDRYHYIHEQYVNDGEDCSITTTTSDEPIDCEPAETVGNKGSCDIRGHDGYYRTVQIITNTAENCQCKREETYKEEFCSCFPDDSSTNCLNNNVKEHVETTYVLKGDTCDRTDTTTIIPVDCASPTLSEGKCDLTSCTQVFELVKHRVKDCQCEEETLTASQLCCAPKDEKTESCIDGAIVTTTTTYRLEPTDQELFPGYPDLPVVKVVTDVVTQSVEVVCTPSTYINEACDEDTGVLYRNTTYNVKDGCDCVPQTDTTTLACRCREGEENIPDVCDANCNQKGVIVTYELEDLACVEKRTPYERKCCCDANSNDEVCDASTGEIVSISIRNQLTSDYNCVSEKSEKRTAVPCNRNEVKEWVTDCDPITGKRTQRTSYNVFDASVCLCKPVEDFVELICSCPETVNTDKICKDDTRYEWNTISYVYSPDTFSCSRVETAQQTFVDCKQFPLIEGVCKPNGYRTLTITVSSPNDCNCDPISESREEICDCSLIPGFETTVTEVCSPDGKTVKKTTTYGVLKKKKCVKETSVVEVQVTCPSDPQTIFGLCSGCDQSVQTTDLVVENCKCVRKVITEDSKKCCCAEKSLVDTSCRDNHFVYTYQSFFLSNGKCEPQQEEEIRTIQCPKDEQVSPVCDSTSCNGELVYKEKQLVDCECQYVETKRTPIECCCKENQFIDVCRDDGVQYRANITYTLEDYVCKETQVEEKVDPNCDAFACRYEVSECVQNYEEVTQYCFRNEKCQCVEYIANVKRQICGCSPDVDEKYGECDDNCNQEIVSIVKVFNTESRTCDDTVSKTTSIKCCCGEGDVTKDCVSNNVIRTNVLDFILQDGVCNPVSEYRDSTIEGCGLEPSVVDTLVGECDTQTGVQATKTILTVAKNCECTNYTETTEKLCCCECIHPPVKEVLCENDITVVTSETVSLLVNDECRDETTTVKRNIDCDYKEWSYRLPCADGAVETLRVFMRQYAKDCQCLTEKVREAPSPCTCGDDVVEAFCNEQEHINVVKVTSFTLVEDNDECEASVSESNSPVECNEGESDSESACDLATNTYYEIHENNFLTGCNCSQTVSKKLCDCTCPEDKEDTFCQDNRIVTVRTTYAKDDCVCQKETLTSETLPNCPNFEPETVGECERNGTSGYRTITRRSLLQDVDLCTCDVLEETFTELCYCEPEEKADKECICDTIIQTTIYNFADNLHGACDWVTGAVSTVTVACPEPETVETCDVDSGVKTTTVYTYQAKDCQCLRFESSTTSRCFCRDDVQDEGKGECDENCQQAYRFSKLVYQDGDCVREGYTELHRCCCAEAEGSRVCDSTEEVGKRFIISRTYHDLVNETCSDRTEVSYDNVICDESLVEEKNCNQETGQLTIEQFQQQTINCQCETVRVSYEEKRCFCAPDEENVVCEMEKSRFRVESTTHSLVDNECVTDKVTNYVEVSCTAPATEENCDETTGELTVTEYEVSLNDTCDCVLYTHTSSRRCWCDPNVHEEVTCNADGEKVRTTYTTLLTPDGQCSEKVVSEFVPLNCEEKSWEVEDDECLSGNRNINFYHQKLDNCNCTQSVTVQPCACDCEAPKPEVQCQDDAIVTLTYTPYVDNCQCEYTTDSYREDVFCPDDYTEVSECGQFNTCERVVTTHAFYVEDCECQKVAENRTEQCCCADDIVSQDCDVSMGTASVTVTSFTLVSGKCEASSTTSTTTGFCQPPETRYTEGECDLDSRQQKWILVSRIADGCDCREEKQEYSRTCACQPPEERQSPCDRTTCLQTFELISYELNENDECVESVAEKHTEQCCCLQESSNSTDCIEDRLINTVIDVVFDEFEKKCLVTQNQVDVSDPCSPESEEHIDECDLLTGDTTLYLTTRTWEQCKCTENTISEPAKCACADDFSEESCVNDDIIQVRSVSYNLVNRKCEETEDISSTLVTCQSSPAVATSECDLFTCKLQVITAHEELYNCSCHLVTVTEEETCCCSKESNTYVYCNEDHENVYLTVSQVFDSDSKSCKTIESERREPTVCDTIGRLDTGPCDIPRDGAFYRKVTHVFEKYVACECGVETESVEELCSCGEPFESKACENGTDNTYRHTPVLVSGDEGDAYCDVVTEVVERRDPLCENKNHEYWGECDASTCQKTFTRLLYFETDDCNCDHNVETVSVTCCCPADFEEKECEGDRYLISVTSFVLDCEDDLNCGCEPVTESREQIVTCPSDSTQKQICENDVVVQPYQIISYHVENCACNNATFTSEDPSTCGECTDVVGYEKCQKAFRRGFCVSNPDVRENACRKTCTNCGCGEGNIRFTEVPNVSLKTWEIPGGLFVVEKYEYTTPEDVNNAVELCEEICRRTDLCKSFEVVDYPEENKRVCYINNADHTDIGSITNNEFVLVPSDRSTYVVRHCKCPDSEEEEVEACKCVDVRENGQAVCFRVLEKTFYEYNYLTQECEPHTIRERATCDSVCADTADKEYCSAQRSNRQCSDQTVKELCLDTCGYCDCSGSTEEVGPCVANLKKVTRTLYHYNELNVCTMSVSETFEPCEPNCKPGQLVNPGPCLNGERVIEIITINVDSEGECYENRTTQVEDCSGCCPTITVTPQPDCSEGYRTVTKEWWARVGDCCRAQRFVDQQRCKDCEYFNVVYADCYKGHQMATTSWEENVGGLCEERTEATLEAC